MSRPKYCTVPNEVFFDPVYCPEAISDYCSRGCDVDRKSRTMAVKKHLSSIGWRFYNALKSGTKKELRYCSPAGRIFHSLLTACQHVSQPPDGEIKRKRKRTDQNGYTCSSQASGLSSEGIMEGSSSENTGFTLDGLAAMLRAFQEEQVVVEEVEFIDQGSIWIDELRESLNVQAEIEKL